MEELTQIDVFLHTVLIKGICQISKLQMVIRTTNRNK